MPEVVVLCHSLILLLALLIILAGLVFHLPSLVPVHSKLMFWCRRIVASAANSYRNKIIQHRTINICPVPKQCSKLSILAGRVLELELPFCVQLCH